MGAWSRLVGDDFLGWLSPRPGQSWVDVGCGNGAFTEVLALRCAPVEILGVDPSERAKHKGIALDLVIRKAYPRHVPDREPGGTAPST